MPLLSAPEHGIDFGLNGLPAPTAQEPRAFPNQCSDNMELMRHCRQCRADVGGNSVSW